MARAESRASVVWKGSLLQGSGKVSAHSGAFRDQPVSWPARTQRLGAGSGVSSPEELLAASLASCFAMQFSSGLAKNGTEAEELRITATGVFEQVGGGWKPSRIDLEVTGQVPGISQSDFEHLAEDAKNNCPISGALKGNVELSVKARLQEPAQSQS